MHFRFQSVSKCARARISRAAGVTAVLGSVLAATALTVPAQAATDGTAQASSAQASSSSLPVPYDFTTEFATTMDQPETPPPGANNPDCQLTAEHPYPVILVHGTFENMDDNWQTASPDLVNHGYCVYAFNYGGVSATDPVGGVDDITEGAQTLSSFVNTVLSETGASKVDLVGHSQGGMMPRYYINDLGGASKVDKLVALAPSNYGTTLTGIVTLATLLGVETTLNGPVGIACESCAQQETGSSFLKSLNATPTEPGVQYTVIESEDDEVVDPYQNAFLPAASNVTNITLQNQCALDQSDHLEIASDPIAMADVLNALDPSDPVSVPCVPVLPAVGLSGGSGLLGTGIGL